MVECTLYTLYVEECINLYRGVKKPYSMITLIHESCLESATMQGPYIYIHSFKDIFTRAMGSRNQCCGSGSDR